MNELQTMADLPKSEAEVIARMKNPPERIYLEASQKADEAYVRKHVTISYPFHDKLKKLGNFLYDIACDVEQAGGWIKGISMDSMSDLRPSNESPNDYRPHGKWRTLFVKITLTTQSEAIERAEAWDEAIKDLFKRK